MFTLLQSPLPQVSCGAFQDFTHLLNKLRNILVKGARGVWLADEWISLEHLLVLFHGDRGETVECGVSAVAVFTAVDFVHSDILSFFYPAFPHPRTCCPPEILAGASELLLGGLRITDIEVFDRMHFEAARRVVSARVLAALSDSTVRARLDPSTLQAFDRLLVLLRLFNTGVVEAYACVMTAVLFVFVVVCWFLTC